MLGGVLFNCAPNRFEPKNSAKTNSSDLGRNRRHINIAHIAMAEIEKIEGNAILQLLEVLQKDKVPLKMRLANDAAEYLTHISAIRKHKRKFQFKINSQAGFLTPADDADGSHR